MAIINGIKFVNQHLFNIAEYFPSEIYFALGRIDPTGLVVNPGICDLPLIGSSSGGGSMTFADFLTKWSEPTTGGYARVQVNSLSAEKTQTSFPNYYVDIISETLSFPISTASWGLTLNACAIFDAATDGALLAVSFLPSDFQWLTVPSAGTTVTGKISMSYHCGGEFTGPFLQDGIFTVLKHAFGIEEFTMAPPKLFLCDHGNYTTGITIKQTHEMNYDFEWHEQTLDPTHFISCCRNTEHMEFEISPVTFPYGNANYIGIGSYPVIINQDSSCFPGYFGTDFSSISSFAANNKAWIGKYMLYGRMF